MDILKLRDQLEDALQSALDTSNVGQRIGEDNDVLAVVLMQEVWDLFEPGLMDGIVGLQKAAPGAAVTQHVTVDLPPRVMAWYVPDDNGAPYKTTAYCGEALEWKMKGNTVLPLYAAPQTPGVGHGE